jgi:hypothetical protein
MFPWRGRAVFLVGLFVLVSAGCNTMQNAAAKDPQRCERDPKCGAHDKSKDCSLQCADDSACVDRCREINLSTGANSR